MISTGDYLTFLKFYARLFCPEIEGSHQQTELNLDNLLNLGNTQMKKQELGEIVDILKHERKNGFDKETKQYIDELIRKTKIVFKKGCKNHEEYRAIYRPFTMVMLELGRYTYLNGQADYAREIIEKIYDRDNWRQGNLYDIAECEKKKQEQNI